MNIPHIFTAVIDKHKLFSVDEIPSKASGRPSSSTYPFENMKVLDGFVAGKYTDELSKEFSSKCQRYSEKLNSTFVTRKVNGFLHIYRTA